jgi:hypothetical protein
MRTQSPDTSPEVERLLIERFRTTPPWRKVAMVEDINRTVRRLALTGLRNRFPSDTPDELRRRWAALVLGPELAAKVYGAPSAAE